jgi:hypothetical protein
LPPARDACAVLEHSASSEASLPLSKDAKDPCSPCHRPLPRRSVGRISCLSPISRRHCSVRSPLLCNSNGRRCCRRRRRRKSRLTVASVCRLYLYLQCCSADKGGGVILFPAFAADPHFGQYEYSSSGQSSFERIFATAPVTHPSLCRASRLGGQGRVRVLYKS